jgi:hypothetical protein
VSAHRAQAPRIVFGLMSSQQPDTTVSQLVDALAPFPVVIHHDFTKRRDFSIVRDHVRLTLQPFDGPPDSATVMRVMDHFRSDDMILFSTDYPHWQFNGQEVWPDGFSDDLKRRVLLDNPRQAYPRLQEAQP